jgi:3-oxoacyl-[acyl-carrier protein] reductase
MDLGLAGRVALVTGGSQGIGLGIAAGLAAEGARVAIAARDERRVRDAAARIGAQPVVFDSGHLDAVPGVIAEAEAALGPLDVYVANTGGPPASEDPLGFSRAEWEAAHRTLVLSPMAFLERLLPGMRERGWARVVAVSSSAVREPIPSLQRSNAHRPGLIAAFKVLARRVAADGVTLNAVLPGRIATDRIGDTFGSMEAAQAAAREAVPAGRLGTVEEIAASVVFLCSAPASTAARLGSPATAAPASAARTGSRSTVAHSTAQAPHTPGPATQPKSAKNERGSAAPSTSAAAATAPPWISAARQATVPSIGP